MKKPSALQSRTAVDARQLAAVKGGSDPEPSPWRPIAPISGHQ
jgi:hypothetical protein